MPHIVADHPGAEGGIAKVDGEILGVVVGQGHAHRTAVQRTVAVDGVVATHIGRGGGVDIGRQGRLIHIHRVGVGAQPRELVEAIGAGNGGGHHVTAAVAQGHRHPLQPWFPSVLDAVTILVVPHIVADHSGAGGGIAKVDGRIVGIVVRQADGYEAAIDRAIAILSVVSYIWSGWGLQAGRKGSFQHVHSVVPGTQASELIKTVGTSGGGLDQISGAVAQFNGGPIDAWLAWVLNAVTIEIVPNEVSNTAGAIRLHHSDLTLGPTLKAVGEAAGKRGILAR